MAEILALRVSVNKQRLTVKEVHELVDSTENIYTAQFSFDEEWDGFVNTVILRNGNVITFGLLDSENKMAIPPEVIFTGRLDIGVHGIKEGASITTRSSDSIQVHKNGGTISIVPEPFTPSQYEELMIELANVRDIATLAIDKTAIAVESAEVAVESAENAQQAEQSAEEYLTAINRIKSEIDNSAQVAWDSANAASGFAGEAKTSEQNAYSSEVNANQSAGIANEQAEISRQQAVIATQKATELATAVEIATSLERNKAGGIVVEANGAVITLQDASNQSLQALTLYGKSTQDGTPTPDAPVEIVSVENPEVKVCGKNLLNQSAIKVTNAVGVTIEYLENEDCFLINGTATGTSGFCTTYINVAGVIGETYCISAKYISGEVSVPTGQFAVAYLGSSDTLDTGSTNWLMVALENQDTARYNTLNRKYICRFWFYFTTGASFTDYKVKIQVEKTEVATEFEPFINGGDLSLPYTLRGIPVTSGGNYTDEAGQQWICDTVELNGDGTGKLVQRVFSKSFNGTEILSNNWYPSVVCNLDSKDYAIYNTPVFCNYFATAAIGNIYGTTLKVDDVDKYGFANADEVETFMLEKYTEGNPVYMQYALITPIETELTADEVAAFMALHTNKPNTTIFNNAGTAQSVEYTADTKLYIDNKLAELVNEVTA